MDVVGIRAKLVEDYRCYTTSFVAPAVSGSLTI
ncbi:MAG: hypothetical protein QG597_274 [Actinomycetota bacterium]|nr:hypothetical protein [Actinomycetota bacterium]